MKRKIKVSSLDLSKSRFFNLQKSTIDFQKLYFKYKNKEPKKIEFSNISSLLNVFRNQSLLKLPDRDIIKEEIGNDIQIFKKAQLSLKSTKKKDKTIDNTFSKISLRKKNKENRNNFLLTLREFERSGKIIYPKKRNKKYIISQDLNPSKILFKRKFYLSEEKKKTDLKRKNSISESSINKTISDLNSTLQKSTSLSMKKTMNFFNNKIEFLTNEVEHSSSRLIKSYYYNIRTFNNDFRIWKKKQEYKFPEIRKTKYNIIKL